MGSGPQRVALVTGGSRGIGASTCLALARNGIDLAIGYRTSEDSATRIAQEVRAMGRRAEIFCADVTVETEAQTLAERALAAFGAIHILINNAGFGSSVVGRPQITEIRLDHLDLLMRAHVYGPLTLCRALVPQMRKHERGDVIMVSSSGVQMLGRNMGNYIMAKAAMEAMAGVLAREERSHGIRVNIVAPGLTDTDMGLGFMRMRAGIESMRDVDAKMPFGFVCQPSDVANTVAFLISDKARYITAQRLTLDGGNF
jgi:NAD(P)-dependent dehydrogenase (short-subunit alcohol dehydrogenase family)